MPSYKLLPKQREFFEIPHDNSLDVVMYQGGYGCVSGDTQIATLFGNIAIKNFNGGFIWTYCKGHKILMFAMKPRIYKKTKLYEVITKSGKRITCTQKHKFLTSQGFKALEDLTVCDGLYTYCDNHEKTNQEYAPSMLHAGVLNLFQTFQGFLLRCLNDYRLYDVQSHLVEDNDRCGLPLQDDVPEHNHLNLQKDVRGISEECTHQYQPDVHLSKNHCGSLFDRLVLDKEYHSGEMSFGQLLRFYLQSLLFLLNSSLLLLVQLFAAPFLHLFGTSYSEPSLDYIDSITYKGEDLYYDLHVPLLNCYNAQGFINHNSGKTWCGSLLGLMLARKYPGCRGLVGAKEYELVKNTTMQSYFEHLDAMGYRKDRDYRYNKVDKKITFCNGSEILFKGLDDPEKFKSLNLHWIEVEEASQISDSSFKGLLGRLRGSLRREWGEHFVYRLFGHTNPQPNKGWIWKRFVENSKENYRLIIAPTSENTNLPEHFVESLKDEYDEEYYRINVLGEFGNYSSGLVVKHFTSDNERKITYNKDLPLYLTCDFNVDPMCWCLAHKDEDNVYFFDELVIENTSTQACIEEFLRRYPDHRNKIIVCGDASGDWRNAQSEFTNYMIIRRALEAKGYQSDFKLRHFNPPILTRIQAFNARVRNAKGDCHVFVDKKCKWLLHNMYNLAFKEGTSIVDVPTVKQIKNDRESKFLEHPFDAASYLVEYFFPIK